jgi:hypothetical protein
MDSADEYTDYEKLGRFMSQLSEDDKRTTSVHSAILLFAGQEISFDDFSVDDFQCPSGRVIPASIYQLFDQDRKIPAIKEVRAHSGIGLKDAKDDCDAFWAAQYGSGAWVRTTWTGP